MFGGAAAEPHKKLGGEQMSVLDTMKSWIFATEDDDSEEAAPATPKEEKRTKPRQTTPSAQTTRTTEDYSSQGTKKSKVVTLNSGGVQEIALLKLDVFGDTKEILNNMKQRIPVVFNLARLDHSEAVRVVDSVYGAAYALDGTMEKASNEIFIVTPNGISITGNVRDRILASNEFSMDI